MFFLVYSSQQFGIFVLIQRSDSLAGAFMFGSIRALMNMMKLWTLCDYTCRLSALFKTGMLGFDQGGSQLETSTCIDHTYAVQRNH